MTLPVSPTIWAVDIVGSPTIHHVVASLQQPMLSSFARVPLIRTYRGLSSIVFLKSFRRGPWQGMDVLRVKQDTDAVGYQAPIYLYVLMAFGSLKEGRAVCDSCVFVAGSQNLPSCFE